MISTAQIITENGHQVIRLPDEFRLEGNEVSVKRVGRSLLLIPCGVNLWDIWSTSLEDFTEDYMSDRSQPSDQDRGLPALSDE